MTVKRYKPDFLIEYTDHKELIEIKPLRLTSKINVLDKKKAAEEFCKKNSMTYKILTEVEFKDLGIFDEKFNIVDKYKDFVN